MTRWQRRLRLGLVVFIAGLAVTLVVSLRLAKAPPPPPILIPHPDPGVVSESTSGRSMRVLGGKPDITVEHYDTMVQYADGRVRLIGVRFKVLQRRGRDFVITSASAEVVGRSPNEDVQLKGAVEITSTDGLVVRTEEASYDHAQGIVRAPGTVRFSRGGLSGSAIGLRYERNLDLLSLLDRVVIHRDAADGDGEIDVEAGSASLARAAKVVRFGHGVRLVRPGETMTTDEMAATLAGDRGRLQRLELRGASRLFGSPRADGGLKAMQARDIDLAYAGDGKTLQHATANGDAGIELAGAAGGAGRRLSGQFIDIALAADGTTPTSLLAQKAVVLELLADASTPARTIRSGVFQAGGTAASGLKAAAFGEGVDFRETPPAPAAPRTATSTTLALTLGDLFGRVQSARFGGGVVFTEGALTARAHDAQYGVDAGTLHLSGRNDKTGRAPQVLDERATIEGDAVDVQLDGRTITAVGSVKTEMRADTPPTNRRGSGQPAGSAQTRVPAMLQADKPVRAAAGHLEYDGGARLATYTGGVELWQDQVSIKADTIVVDERSGGLSARGGVVSRMAFDRTDGAAKAQEPSTMVVTSDKMAYDDEARRVAYTGRVHLNGAAGDLSADEIAVFLRAGTRELERLEASGAVALRSTDGRRAAGQSLVYRAQCEQYDVVGAPARLDDTFGATTGRFLTFYRSTARIVVDGKEQKRTELRREIKR
jgi:lipopolysaccharide export system protein LptA